MSKAARALAIGLLAAGCSESLPSLPSAASLPPAAAGTTADAAKSQPVQNAKSASVGGPAPTAEPPYPAESLHRPTAAAAGDVRQGAAGRGVGAAVRGAGSIVGFRGPNVTLFSSDTGNEGERVTAGSLSVPIVLQGAPTGGRVMIPTVYGPRWVATAEVVLDGGVTAGR